VTLKIAQFSSALFPMTQITGDNRKIIIINYLRVIRGKISAWIAYWHDGIRNMMNIILRQSNGVSKGKYNVIGMSITKRKLSLIKSKIKNGDFQEYRRVSFPEFREQ
jgi:hypothetical protein